MTEQDGFEVAERFMALDKPPTAYLCSSSLLAMGVARAAKQRGLTIGKDIALVAHDDVLQVIRTENLEVPLTVIRAPIRNGGVGVADCAIKLMKNPRAELSQVVEPVELVIRESSCPAPKN